MKSIYTDCDQLCLQNSDEDHSLAELIMHTFMKGINDKWEVAGLDVSAKGTIIWCPSECTANIIANRHVTVIVHVQCVICESQEMLCSK